jgi:hypothetical protein
MSKLQYIKLFEAFESVKLTKTLGYIKDKKDKSTFLDRLKRVCSSIDFPYSKLSDEFFEYLPFKKALDKAAIVTDEPCVATSRSEFPDHAIEGEKCTDGKIKRMWGSRVRSVVCPTCNGTGVKPKNSEIKLIKFWFTSDGRYVANTAVDGVTRAQFKEGTFSRKIGDYDVVKSITNHDDLQSLNTGDIILAEIGSDREETICYVYKEGGNRVYALQDDHDGSSPSDSNWRKIARNSWHLGRGEYRSVKVLKLKKGKEETKFVVNPYEWNANLDFSWSGMYVRNNDVKTLIKDAHFAIVMDFGKLKESGFMKKQDIITQRAETKIGSKLDPEQSDKEIKRRNIERYMSELSKRLDISSDISNCNKLISKSLGYRNALYTIIPTSVSGEFSTITDYYLKIMSVDDSDKEYYVDRMKDKVQELFKWSQKRNITVSAGLDGLRKKLLESDRKEHVEFLDKFNELSATVYKKLSDYNIESIEDFEVVCQKMITIKNILKSDRYGLSRFCSYVLDYLNRGDDGERAFRYMIDPYYFNPEQYFQLIERVSRIIEKI